MKHCHKITATTTTNLKEGNKGGTVKLELGHHKGVLRYLMLQITSQKVFCVF